MPSSVSQEARQKGVQGEYQRCSGIAAGELWEGFVEVGVGG